MSVAPAGLVRFLWKIPGATCSLRSLVPLAPSVAPAGLVRSLLMDPRGDVLAALALAPGSFCRPCGARVLF
jgi:hypothetical protein